MISALVMLNVEKPKVNGVAKQLAAMTGVREVYSVAGKYDLVALIKVKNHEEIAELVTDKMLGVEGIISSETLISFRVYSQDDQERMFSIGMDE